MSDSSLDRLCELAEDRTDGIIKATNLKQCIRIGILLFPAIFAGYITYWYGYWEDGEWNKYVMWAIAIAALVTTTGVVWLVKGGIKLFTAPLGWKLAIVILVSLVLLFFEDKAEEERHEYQRKSLDALIANIKKSRAESDRLLQMEDSTDRRHIEADRLLSTEDLLKDFGAFRRKIERTYSYLIEEYEGKEVTWTLLLCHAGYCSEANRKRQLKLRELSSVSCQRKEDLPDVFFSVKCSTYVNELLNIDRSRGAVVRVRGTIRSIRYDSYDQSYIALLQDDPEITFLSGTQSEK